MKGLRIIAGSMLILACGCSQKAMTFLEAPEPPIVWPAAPDQPRVRYVGELTGSEDLGRGKSFGEVWNEILYGPQKAPRLVTPQAVAVNDVGDKVAVADVNGKCVHVFDLTDRKYTALVQVAGGTGWNTGGRAASGTGQDTGGQADVGTAARGTENDTVEHAGGSFLRNTLECPVAVCWAGERLWIADSVVQAVAIFEAGGASRWIATDKLKRPAGLAYNHVNQLCYVADAGSHRILAFDAKGELLVEFGSRGGEPGQFNCPSHMAVGPDGTLLVADSLNFRLQRLGMDGSPMGCFGRKGDAAGDLALPKGVAVDADGVIWVVDAHFENVQAFNSQGRLLMAFGKEGHQPGEFWLPAGICIDKRNRMWVADRENGRVQVFALMP